MQRNGLLVCAILLKLVFAMLFFPSLTKRFFFFLISTLQKKKSAEGRNPTHTECIQDTPNPKRKNTNLKSQKKCVWA